MMNHDGWMSGSMGGWLPTCVLIAALVIAAAITLTRISHSPPSQPSE